MQKKLRKIISYVLSGVMAAGSMMSPYFSDAVYATDIPVRANITEEATDSTIIIGVKGLDNTSKMQNLLDRVNAIRREACEKGYPDPRKPNENLSEEDYHSLEIGIYCNQAAQIRAAEASVKAAHARPISTNSHSCVDIIKNLYPECLPAGENLAWNSQSGSDIEGWIDEKDDWITYKTTDLAELKRLSGQDIQTGHYAALINPDFYYTGMSTFNPVNDTSWWYCTEGTYAKYDLPMESLPDAQNAYYIQKMPVNISNVTEGSISGDAIVNVGDSVSYKLLVDVSYTVEDDGAVGDNTVRNCPVYAGITWSSGDESILSIDENGEATIKKTGSVEIIAQIGSGTDAKSYSRNILVLGDNVTVTGAINPDTITVESGCAPVLRNSVKMQISDGSTVDVDVEWDDYDDDNLYTEYKSNDFNITGTAFGYPVTQSVHVKPAEIVKVYTSAELLTVDCGTCPETVTVYVSLNQNNKIVTYGYPAYWNYDSYSFWYVEWDKTTLNKYKTPSGGDFKILGYVIEEGDDGEIRIPVEQPMHVNPATVTGVQFKSDGATIETISGTKPVYPKATVSWSYGDPTEEDITWDDAEPSTSFTDPDDVSRKYNMRSGGDYQLTGTYNGESTNITVRVKPAVATKAAIATASQNISVNYGTNPTSMLPDKATVTWSNGDTSTESITWNAIDPDKYSGEGVLKGNSFSATGSCKGVAVSVNVTVYPATIKSITSPDAVTVSEKVSPESFLPETVTVIWNDNSSSQVEAHWNSIDASSYASPGSFNVIGYIIDTSDNHVDISCQVIVEERKPTGIALKDGKLTSDTSYYTYDISDIAGTIIITYDNGETSETAITPAMISNLDTTSTASNQNITITYSEGTVAKTLSTKVYLVQRTGIRIKTKPTKTAYIEDECTTLNIDGIEVEELLDNNTCRVMSPDEYSVSDFSGFNPNPTTYGNQTITLSLYGFKATYAVKVSQKELKGITLTPPTKTEYVKGAALDYTGLKLTGRYDNGKYYDLPLADAIIKMNPQFKDEAHTEMISLGEDVNTSSIGSIKVYVYYPDKAGSTATATSYHYVTFMINVIEKSATSVSIETLPSKLSFPQNDVNYNSSVFSDGSIRVTFIDESEEIIGFSDAEISDFDISKVGNQTAKVSYGGKSATFDVTVTEPTVTAKSITAPTKKTYTKGEALDMSGSKFVITLNNGRKEEYSLTDANAMAQLKAKYGYTVKAEFVDASGKPTDSSSTGTKILSVKCIKNGVEESIKMAGGASVSVQVKEASKPSGGGNSGGGNSGGGNSGGGNSGGGSGNSGGGNSGGGMQNARNTLVTTSNGSQYIKSDGSFAKNEWVTINGIQYYFNADSYNASNEWRDGKWISSDGSCTYAGKLSWKSNSTGWWVEDSVGWYPTKCWQKIDGIWYYFNSSGYMASGEWYEGYWFNSDGSWDPTYKMTWKGNSSGWWIEDISGWWPSNSWQKIDGYWYYFDGTGYMVTNQYIGGYWIGSDGVCY